MQSYKSYSMGHRKQSLILNAKYKTTWCHHKPLHPFHAKLQVLLHCHHKTNLSFTPCKVQILLMVENSTYPFHLQRYKSYYMCHHKQSLLVPFHHAKLPLTTSSPQEQSLLILGVTMQSYKSYYMVSPQGSLYPFHHAKLVLSLTTWCHHKQSLLILFTMQSYKSYYMVSPQTVFTYAFHHAKLQVLLHGVTTNSLYLSFSPCKATSLTTWCHRKQSLLMLFTMQSYKSYYMVSPQTVFTYPFHHAKLQILLHGVTANSLYLSFSPCKATNLTYGVTAYSLYLSFSAKLQVVLKYICFFLFFNSPEQVRVEATVIEKTKSEKKVVFKMRRRTRFHKYHGKSYPLLYNALPYPSYITVESR